MDSYSRISTQQIRAGRLLRECIPLLIGIMLRFGLWVVPFALKSGQETNRQQFIRQLEIPYCTLYDQGYTSLGGTTDTHPNPVLKSGDITNETENKAQTFRPAYELVEDDAERLGRRQ